jgi:hypothetical protein
MIISIQVLDGRCCRSEQIKYIRYSTVQYRKPHQVYTYSKVNKTNIFKPHLTPTTTPPAAMRNAIHYAHDKSPINHQRHAHRLSLTIIGQVKRGLVLLS